MQPMTKKERMEQ